MLFLSGILPAKRLTGLSDWVRRVVICRLNASLLGHAVRLVRCTNGERFMAQ